ncbi:hypothetical protein [Pseudonocardia sp. GCM10023141]|uniref:hypothetical protein n=1 Tax=Pseudonocardia sp. GCM10023141 TaxID=3252653 RepID=UPI00362000EF
MSTTTATTTATAALTPAPTSVAVAPATRFRRKALGTAAVAGGVLTAAGFAATVWETAPDKLSYLDSLVADPIRSQIAALLLHYGYYGIVPVLLALGIMTRRTWRVGGNIGLALSMGGALALPGLLVTDFYDMAIRQNLPADQAVAVSDAAGNLPLAGFVGGPLIMLTFLGMTMLGVAAWRAGFFHWALVLPVPVSVASVLLPIGAATGIAQGALLGLFMITVGIAVFRMTDQEWVSGARGAGR